MTVEKLLAIEELKALKSNYFFHVDGKHWAELAELFTEDCRFELEEREAIIGPRDFVATVEPALRSAVSVHHGHDPVITILDEYRAEGRWAMEDNIRWPADNPWNGYVGLKGFGHYFEQYRRTAAGWRICALKLTRQRVDYETAAG